MLDGFLLGKAASNYERELLAVKDKIISAEFLWYPYGTLNNFIHLQDCFNKHPLDSLTSQRRIADIGGADGDLAFFLASLGYSVDIYDYGPTNYNGLRGARELVRELRFENTVSISEVDIDSQFTIPSDRYDLIFLLGILYHLKNPYFIMEHLAKKARHLVISTRVARFTPDGLNIYRSPVAYLLSPDESNNDATNYWIFTEAALVRLINRSGWEVMYSTTVGDQVTSNPADADRDERIFMLLKSKFVRGFKFEVQL
jgi:2-polyprenyl-3-methyl-5-hydroxy-6-metoxy-1,4-benzoquinol methylase